MVLLQRGTTRLAGRVNTVKNEKQPPCRKSAKRRALQCVYYAVYRLYTLYSLLFGRVRCICGLVCALACTDAAKTLYIVRYLTIRYLTIFSFSYSTAVEYRAQDI